MTDLANVMEHPQIVEEASDWIAKLDRGLSADEESTFKAWLFKRDENYAVFMNMARVWDKMDALEALVDIKPKAQSVQRNVWRTALPIAASFLVVSVLAFWQLSSMNETVEPVQQAIQHAATTYETGVGERSEYILEDGSRIVLNTRTRVTVVYTDKNRFLNLEAGELHVEVARDLSRPLSVFHGDRVVQAVGTEFNVEITDDKRIEIVVTEGIVQVGVVDPAIADSIADAPIALDPSEPTISAGHEVVVAQNVTATPVAPEEIKEDEIAVKLSWRDGNLVFRGKTVEEAVAEIGRYTSVEFVILDENAKAERVSGVFKTGDVDKFLASLRTYYNVRYERVADNKILLSTAEEE